MSQNNNSSSFTNHQCIRNGNIQNKVQNEEHIIETIELYSTEDMKNSNAFKLYKKSLDFAMSNNNDKVNNIAIIGSQDGQNQNVIETYKSSRKDFNIANVSLANTNNELLESEIINQISGQVTKKNVNQANNKTSVKHVVLWTALTSIFILLSVVFFSFSARKIIAHGWSKSFDLNHLGFFLPVAFILFGMIVGFLAIAIYYGRNYLLDLKKSKNIVVQETKEIVVIEDKEKLVNLIDKSGLDALIIEDLGESKDYQLIKRIKDINTLVNKRRQKRIEKVLAKLENKKEQINKLLSQSNLSVKELSWIKQIEDVKLNKVLINDFNMYSDIHNFRSTNTMGDDIAEEFKKDYNNKFEEIVKYVNSLLQNNVFSKIKNQNNLALNAFKALKQTLGENNKIAQELAYAGCSIHYQEIGFDPYIESQLDLLRNNSDLEIFFKTKKPNESRYLITYVRKALKNNRSKLFTFLIYKNLFSHEYSNLLEEKGWLYKLNSIKKQQYNRLFKIVENESKEKVFANIKLDGKAITVKSLAYLLTFNLCSQLNLDMNLTESFYWSREFVANAIVDTLTNKENSEVVINREILMDFTQDEYNKVESNKNIINFEKAREEITEKYQIEHLELIEQLFKESYLGLDCQYYMNDSHQLSSEIKLDNSDDDENGGEKEVDLNVEVQNVDNLEQLQAEAQKVVDLENLANFEEAEIEEKKNQKVETQKIEEDAKETITEIKEEVVPETKVEEQNIKVEEVKNPSAQQAQPNQPKFNLNKPQDQYQQTSRLRQVNPNMYQNVQYPNQYQNFPNKGYVDPRFAQYPPRQNPYYPNQNYTNINVAQRQPQNPNNPIKQ